MNYDKIFWQQRQLERALVAMRRPMLSLTDMLPASVVSHMRDLQMLADRFTLPAQYLTISDKILSAVSTAGISGAFSALDSISRDVTRAFSELQGSITQMASKSCRPATEAALAVQAMEDSLVPTEALLRLNKISPLLMDISLRPHIAFGEFASARVALADAASEALRTNTLTTIASGSALLAQMTRGPELACLLSPSVPEVLPLPEVNVFSSLEGALACVDLEADDADVKTVVSTAPSGVVVELGARIVELVYNLNVEGEREGQGALFKPTSKTMRAFHVVPTRVANNEESFYEIVDQLFFLLYEGSGNAKRIKERMSRDRLDALWRLKHLRLASRHDVDHGSESDAQRKAMQVGRAYHALIGKTTPRSGYEWSRAQMELYRELAALLEEMWGGG